MYTLFIRGAVQKILKVENEKKVELFSKIDDFISL